MEIMVEDKIVRPVVELMYRDFVGVCLDQLLNQAAKAFVSGPSGAGILGRP